MKFIKKLLLLLILFFVVTISFILFIGFRDSIGASDTIVVLGNEVKTSGIPSERLKSRLDKSIELYKKNISPKIIVSGGVGKEGFDEAEVMKKYLIQNGVPEKLITVDNKGVNTYATAINTKAILKNEDLDSVIIVTNYYHIARTILAFNKVGINSVYHAHANYFESRDVYSIIREFIAIYSYLIK